jgi:hypothetical protein
MPVTIAITKAATYTLIITILAITTRIDSRAVITIAEVVVTTYSTTRSALCIENKATS